MTFHSETYITGFIDLRNSTPAMRQYTLHEMAVFLEEFYQLATENLASAQLLSYIGDAVLAVYSASQAEEAADQIADCIQKAPSLLPSLLQGAPNELELGFGAGVAVGPAIFSRLRVSATSSIQTIIGESVNFAQRLSSIARPSEILTTAEVLQLPTSFEIMSSFGAPLPGFEAFSKIFSVTRKTSARERASAER